MTQAGQNWDIAIDFPGPSWSTKHTSSRHEAPSAHLPRRTSVNMSVITPDMPLGRMIRHDCSLVVSRVHQIVLLGRARELVSGLTRPCL